MSAPQTPAAGQEMQWGTRPSLTEMYTIGSTDPKSGYKFQIQLTNSGAAIYTLKLADFYATAEDKQLAKKLGDDQEYIQEAAADPKKYGGHYSLLNPLPIGSVRTSVLEADLRRGLNVPLNQHLYLPLATRSVTISSADMASPLTWDLSSASWRVLPQAETAPEDSQSISFEWTLARRSDGEYQPYVRIVKTYTIHKGDFGIDVSLRMENVSGQPLTISVDQAGPSGLPREDVRSDMRKLAYGRLEEQKVQVRLEDARNKDRIAAPLIGSSAEANPVIWFGQTNKFFGSYMYLLPSAGEEVAAPRPAVEFYARAVSEGGPSQVFTTRAQMQPVELAAGKSTQIKFDMFAGPKQRELFSEDPLYSSLNYMTTIELSVGCPCSFDWLALAIMTLLEWLAKVLTFGNYGVAIIILVVVVRVLLHPLTKKGQISMMKMQKLGPKMQQIKEKYKDDKDTLQRETMKFYKEQGTTPILGCLPMLLQMPIWIALYSGLNADVELRHAAFLPFWITNLAGLDALVSWANTPIYLPLLSGFMGPIISLNLLPILLTVAMYYQTKLTPTAVSATATPQQLQQQKMMRIMTPAMMLLFFYNAPAGLTLYIMASTASGVIEQIVIRKHIKEQEELQAASETTISMPGKGARGSRGKKPKGPFWTKKG